MLTENQQKLLADTISQLASDMQDPEFVGHKHMRQTAFDLYLKETNESVQVQITVTRDTNDYLGFLETEVMQ